MTTPPPHAPHPSSPHPHPSASPHAGDAALAAGRFIVTSTHVTIAWVAAVLTCGYMLPWAVAATRGKSNSVAVALLTALTGWTIIGWFVGLIMACAAEPVQNVTYVAPSQPMLPPAGWYPGPNGQPQYWNGQAWMAPPVAP